MTKIIVIGKGKILSRSTIFGDLIFISGIGPHDPKTGKQVKGGIKEQTKMVMERMKVQLPCHFLSPFSR